MAVTRFGSRGIAERPAGSFAGKAAMTEHNPGRLTRFGPRGIMEQEIGGTFAGKAEGVGGGGVLFRPIIRPRKR